MPNTSQRAYYPALDGLRLLAMAAVVLHHSVGPHHQSMMARLLAFQTGNGIGPPLFFLLSGLLLTTILLQTREQAHRYRRFLVRRSVRILPLYYLYLLLAVVGTVLVTGRLMQAPWIYGLFLQGTLLHAAEQTGSVLPMYHLWTLGAQEQFYLLWPLVVWRCGTLRQLRWTCWGGLAISAAARLLLGLWMGGGEHLSMLLPCRLGEMVLGGLLAVELLEPTALSRVLRWMLGPLWAVYGVWAMRGLQFQSVAGSVVGIALVAMAGAAAILSAAHPGTVLNRLLAMRPIAVMGKRYSYGIYIFHPLMLTVFSLPVLRGWRLRYPLEMVCLAAVVLLSYHGFERRFLRIGTFISARARAEMEAREMTEGSVARA